jgi:hypothetical protein
VLLAAGRAVSMLMVIGFLSFMAFAFPFAGALLLVRAAHWTRFAPIEIAALAVLVAATLAAAWWSFAETRVHRWLDVGRGEAMLASIVTLGLAIGTFASLTQSLYDRGHLELQGDGVSSDAIVDLAFEFYVWHLLDSVPLLDIPQTLRWTVPYTYTDSVSGAVLLAFKVFVIVPLIQVARLILAGRRRQATAPPVH